MNNLMLVGRLVKDPEIKELESGKKVSNITLAINRNFKNVDGVYETDFVDCVLWNSIASNTAEYCRKGDLIGVKGRIETNTFETESGEKKKATNIVADKITFLSSKSSEKTNDDELDM